ncbi:uncharacterized protein LOC131948825 [Physella acuta]|uniref:uncharacterized protein LOC131948825 n=1 Tax=Physella acuta TaxID=109671 RepID=UPI0027DCBDAF|nr:uncharacterized protein LOC131948825 [Physella acuta]
MVYQIKMDDAFVLKEIKLNKEEIQKEKQEIDILLQLEHRRIVPFYGYEIKENALLLYFQKMEKGSLDTFIDANGVLSEKQTCLYTRQILDGLNYLHLHKPQIIHRDIKGGNILMENSSSVKLSDFGVSKIISELTEARTHAGTFKWMAPEIILGEKAPYTVKADIWSVGCTVVEMLTGKPPFHNLGHPQRILKMLGKIKPEYQLNPEASQELQDFLDAIFIYNPSDRPSAYELIDHPFVAFKYQAAVT